MEIHSSGKYLQNVDINSNVPKARTISPAASTKIIPSNLYIGEEKETREMKEKSREMGVRERKKGEKRERGIGERGNGGKG